MRLEKLRTIRALRVSKTTVQHTSNATSILRKSVALRTPEIRDEPDCKTCCGLIRTDRSDGNVPNAIAVSIDKPAAKNNIGQLRCTSFNRGRLAGAKTMNTRTP